MKKLDTTRDYGTIRGDHEASFEQDGLYFDANGEQIGGTAQVLDKATKPKTPAGQVNKAPTPAEIAVQMARDFVTKLMLPNEPVARSVVAREAEIANVLWEHVEAQFKALGGVSTGKGAKVVWKLPVPA